jgi:translation initiation factor 5A
MSPVERALACAVFTGKKYDDTLNLTAGFHGIDAPVTRKATYALMDVDAGTGFLSLLTDGGSTKEDAALGRAEDGSYDEVGSEIVRRFGEGEALKVSVLTIMGKDLVVEVAKDTSAA